MSNSKFKAMSKGVNHAIRLEPQEIAISVAYTPAQTPGDRQVPRGRDGGGGPATYEFICQLHVLKCCYKIHLHAAVCPQLRGLLSFKKLHGWLTVC